MSTASIVPKPVYTMVDLNKKRKDRKFFTETCHECDGSEGIKAGSERATGEGFPMDLNLSSISDNRGMSSTHSYAECDAPKGKSEGATEQGFPADINHGSVSESRGMSSTHTYEEAAECHPAINEEASTPGATRLAKSSYTMITKETLLPPQGTEYEDTNISVNASQRVPKKGSAQKYWCSVIIPVVLFFLFAMSSGLAFTIVKIFELQSRLDSLQYTSDISGLMQNISELRANQFHVKASLMQLEANQSHVKVGLLQLRANVHVSLVELRANQSFLSDELDQHILEHLREPAPSCVALLAFSPTTPSGYYWVRAGNGSAVRVYCDMTRSCGGVTGGWMRVASLDFSNSSTPCPNGLQERMDSGIRTCGIQSASAACATVSFSTGLAYTKVCGKVLAYQLGTADAFGNFGRGPSENIDANYVDGVSLTHGSNPREHIWTFAAALDEFGHYDNGAAICECSHSERSGGRPPAFVGQDYFCDSGITSREYSTSDDGRLLSDSPLWDGSGCGFLSTCCSFNNPPWFHRQLPSPTSDAIEMRVCSDEERETEDIAMSSAELFVQ